MANVRMAHTNNTNSFDSNPMEQDESGKVTPPPEYTAQFTYPTAPPPYTDNVNQPHQPYEPNPPYRITRIYNLHAVPFDATDNEGTFHPKPADHMEVSTVVAQRESFVGEFILSCFVTWFCFWPFGVRAFLLAWVAHKRSQLPDEYSAAEAHRLGVQSRWYSYAGVIAGVFILIGVIIYVLLRSKTVA